MFLKNIGYATLIGAMAFGLVFGATGTSDAKGKKDKMAALVSTPIVCLPSSGPVCGVKGGQRFTYHNSCFAQQDGAKAVSSGACKVRVAKKVTKKTDKMEKKTDKKTADKPAKK